MQACAAEFELQTLLWSRFQQPREPSQRKGDGWAIDKTYSHAVVMDANGFGRSIHSRSFNQLGVLRHHLSQLAQGARVVAAA